MSEKSVLNCFNILLFSTTLIFSSHSPLSHPSIPLSLPPLLSSSPGDSKKRLQPIGAEVKTKYVDSSSSRQYNGLLKRSSFASDGLPVIRGSHGTVTLGTRRSSAADAVTTATCDPFVDGIGNGHTSSSSSSKYPLPPIV